MNVVRKYPVVVVDAFVTNLPEGARCLTVQVMDNEAYIWALVDPDRPTQRRTFRLVATGHQFDATGMVYVGTFQFAESGTPTYHLFERPS